MAESKLKRRIAETYCPACNAVLSWDAIEDITDRMIKIACWCSKCKQHKYLAIQRVGHDVRERKETKVQIIRTDSMSVKYGYLARSGNYSRGTTSEIIDDARRFIGENRDSIKHYAITFNGEVVFHE